MSTNIRSSSQLYIDDNLNFNSKKGVSLQNGSADSDAATVGQMNTAISNATSGLGNSIHVPVADLAAAKAVVAIARADKMLMLIETLGLYRYDLESSVASNDTTIIRPTDIASDATSGRWIKISSTITDHSLLSALQGGTTGEYYHLTNTELLKLQGIASGATANAKATGAEIDTGTDDAKFATPKAIRDSGLVSTAAAGEFSALTAKNTPVDADEFLMEDSAASAAKKKLTWQYLKATLKTYFDTLYNLYVHPNHSGDVTSVGDGAQTIAAKAVTLAKMADMATASFIGRKTAATGVPEILSVADVKTLLGLTTSNQSTRTYRATPAGTINGSNTAFTISALVLSGTEEVFKNGILMNAGAGNDYTISYGATTTITFETAPASTPFADIILVSYSV